MMMTERNDLDDAGLEAFFAASREAAPEPSVDLLARVLADAEAAQVPAVAVAAPRGWWAAMLDGVGFAGAGGLVAATVAGFFIGINPGEYMPDVMAPMVEVFGGPSLDEFDDTEGLMGLGWDLDEG